MNIRAIELTNFRNYESQQLVFDQPRTLVVGPNGAGKSSLIDAIAWCLTGRCRGVNARGEGQKDLIRIGADQATVEVDLGDFQVTRTISRNGSASCSMKTDQILGHLGTSEGMLHAILYGQTFFDLHHGEAKALLMAALDVRIPKAQLPGVKLPADMDEADLDTLEACYQTAFEERTVVKRQLAAHAVPDKPKVIDMALAGRTVDELGDQLKVAQAELGEAMQAEVDAQRDLDQRQHEIDQAEELAGQVGKLEGAMQAHEGMLAKHQGLRKEAGDALAAAQAEQAEPVEQLQAQVREAEVLVDKLGRHDPDRGCVLAASIPCLTKAAEFSGQVDTLRKSVKDLGKRVKAGQERAAAIAAAQQRVRDEDRNVTYHDGQIADTGQKLAAARKAADQVKTLKAGLAELKRAAKKAASAVPEHQARVDQAMASWKTVVEYQTALAAYQAAVTKRADLEDAVDKAEALVTLLGPKGIRLQALADALAVFNAAISQALEPFGFQLHIQVDPWRVIVTQAGESEGVRFEMLSKGQRLFTGLAFQLALADVSGLDFVVIDDVEAVVGKARQLLTATVMTSDLGQILVSMAKAADEPVPNLDGLQVVRMEQRATVAA